MSKWRDKARVMKLLYLTTFLGLLYCLYWVIISRNCYKIGWEKISRCNSWWKICTGEDCKVTIDVYYEILCPDSMNFISNQLFPLAMKLREEDEENQDIIHFNMWAFGKAKEKGIGNSSVFECQHGKDECIGNAWHACAWNHKFRVSSPDAMYFVGCTMSKNNFFNSIIECSSHANMDYTELKECAEGTEGHSFMHLNGIQTNSLIPKLYYVPWIIVNGEYSDATRQKAETNLLALVCNLLEEKNLKMCQQFLI
ncbi:unnamed protein product [Gordionus sp. m RMFG-2023]